MNGNGNRKPSVNSVRTQPRIPKAAGGWKAIAYTFRKAREAGGIWAMTRAMRSRNACKTCALGMGGQLGGMVNERGRWPSLCKKSLQAMAADMAGRIREDFFHTFSIQQMQAMTPRELEKAGRIVEPLYAGPGDRHYRYISWDEALRKVVAKLKATPADDTFFYFSGRSSNEAGFLLQLFARLYGTNNVNNCSYYCHQASGVGLTSVTGSGTATVVLEDVEHADLLFIIGGNPASNHPRLMHTILDLKRRGGKVIVVNPLREVGLVRFKVPSDPWSLLFGHDIADVYIQPHIGGDIAFMTGVAKSILERGAIDRDFIDRHTDGWPHLEAWLREQSWEEIERTSGVERRQIEEVAEMYAKAKNTIFSWAMGITHHEHGVKNVQMIGNLAMMRGNLGRQHAGLMPLRGHSNIQGIGSVGVTPRLKDTIFRRLQDEFGVQLPHTRGLDTMGCMEKAMEGGFRFAWCLGGNLYGSNPDAEYARRALSRIDMVLYLNTTLNTGHTMGLGKETLILPVLARDEEPQSTTQESMFNYVRLSDGGPRRYEGPRTEVEIIAHVAREVLGDRTPIDWKSMEQHRNIRAAIAKVVPGYEEIGRIDETKKEFQIEGRTFHEPKFATKTGRAHFHTFPIPPLKGGPGELRLMTVRSEGQFNTVVYEDEDIYRGQERRDVIMLNPEDRRSLGLELDQRVTVRSQTGALGNVLVREIDIPPGNAVMYYPEANVLVPRETDLASRTPAFKCVLVTVSTEQVRRQIEHAPAAVALDSHDVGTDNGNGHGNGNRARKPAREVTSARH